MKELHDIIVAYDNSVLQKKRTALVTVVQVDGSSYRRPGARMLVTEDGQITGAISGGCLEGDALRKAQLAIRRQQNRLEIYDTTDTDDLQLGVQLGCNGIVYLLFEPIVDENADHPIRLLKKMAAQRAAAVLATVYNRDKNAPQTGTCCLYQTSAFSDTPDAEGAQNALALKQSIAGSLGGEQVLYQYIPPAVQLVIAGAGNDAQPLVEMAFLLGWQTTVVDGRPAYATPQRFPRATAVCVAKPEQIHSAVRLDERTAVVLMTHNYRYDVVALGQLLRTGCAYLGVLGPKQKLDSMLDELQAKGITQQQDSATVYGPVGLDIGAETSEEIALAVLAEIKAVFSDRSGGSLRERELPIHERAILSGHG